LQTTQQGLCHIRGPIEHLHGQLRVPFIADPMAHADMMQYDYGQLLAAVHSFVCLSVSLSPLKSF